MSFLKEYTFLGELGKGGFAKVYKVRHNDLGYIRAIRVLNEPVAEEKSKVYQNFLRECKVLLRLGNGNHRSIVHIYQPRLLESHALVEMDYVDGEDLTQYLKANGNFLPIGEVLRLVEEISSALAYCHEDIYQFCLDPDEDDLQNDPVDGKKWLMDKTTRKRLIEKYKVIHNDIHSGNIMRRKDGSFVLLDFGLAIEGEEVVKSSSRHENGAPEYMPPEKWDDETILTEQSDIYSFGVVMYEYLAGRVPFVCEGDSFNARKRLYEKIKSAKELPSIVDLRKSNFEKKFQEKKYENDVPDWLEQAILKCLEKDPSKRFRNGKELYEYISSHIENNSGVDETIWKLSAENRDLIEKNQKALAQIDVLHKQYQLKLDNKTNELIKVRKRVLLFFFLSVLLLIASSIFSYLYFNEDMMIPDDYEAIKTENTELKQKNEGFVLQLADLQNQLNNSNTSGSESLKKAQDRVKELETQNQKLKDQVVDLNSQVSNFKDRMSSLEGQIASLESQKQRLNKEISDLKNNASGNSSWEKELESQLAQVKNKCDRLTKEKAKLNSDIYNLEASIASKDAQIAKLNNEIKALQDNCF